MGTVIQFQTVTATVWDAGLKKNSHAATRDWFRDARRRRPHAPTGRLPSSFRRLRAVGGTHRPGDRTQIPRCGMLRKGGAVIMPLLGGTCFKAVALFVVKWCSSDISRIFSTPHLFHPQASAGPPRRARPSTCGAFLTAQGTRSRPHLNNRSAAAGRSCIRRAHRQSHASLAATAAAVTPVQFFRIGSAPQSTHSNGRWTMAGSE